MDIEKHGQIQPIAVEQLEDGSYILLAGGRRYVACLGLGLEIDCRVYRDLDDVDRRTIELIENVQRKSMSFREKALLTEEIHRLKTEKYGAPVDGPKKKGHSQTDTSKILGVSRTEVVANLELAKTIREAPEVIDGAKNRSEAIRMITRKKHDKVTSETVKREEKKLAEKPSHYVTKMLSESYVVGDFFERVGDLREKSFNMAEIDPPFGIDLDKIKDIQRGGLMDSYHEVSAKDYPKFIERTIIETKRVLREDGWIILWHGQDWKELIYNLLLENGFKTNRLVGIWVKMKSSTQVLSPQYSLGSNYESFFYARMPQAEIDMGYRGYSNTLMYPPVNANKKIHVTEKPLGLIKTLINRFSPYGGKILCPFLGSGNTIIAAHDAGASAIGFDLSQEHRDKYILRVLARGEEGQKDSDE